MKVFSLAFVLGCFGIGALIGGRYSTVPGQDGGVYVIDRATGDAVLCAAWGCQKLSLDADPTATP